MPKTPTSIKNNNYLFIKTLYMHTKNKTDKTCDICVSKTRKMPMVKTKKPFGKPNGSRP
jgi:hypothetical protein